MTDNDNRLTAVDDDESSVHIVYGAGLEDTPMLGWMRENLLDTKFHGPGDATDDLFGELLADPMIQELLKAHRPKVCSECGAISPVEISDDWIAFARKIEHEADCPDHGGDS